MRIDRNQHLRQEIIEFGRTGAPWTACHVGISLKSAKLEWETFASLPDRIARATAEEARYKTKLSRKANMEKASNWLRSGSFTDDPEAIRHDDMPHLMRPPETWRPYQSGINGWA